MSGSNGIYDSSKTGGGIASWWGGSMKDRNDYTSQNMPADVAKGLVRFDGTGYLANGNLWWDNNGKLHADPLSFFVGPENVGDLLSIFQIVKSGTSINYVVPRYPFQKLSISSYLELGSGYRIKVDEANNAIYVEKDGGGIVNFYATGGITALGVGTKSPQTILDALPIDTNTLSKEGGKLTVIGGGSGGNTGAISLNGQRYDSVDGVITLPNLATPEDITTALNGYATQAWVTDKNYATQSWVNGKGYVTATALATMGFATQAWVNSQGFLKSNSLDNYVTLNTIQTITGTKTFNTPGGLKIGGPTGITLSNSSAGNLIVANLSNTAQAGIEASLFKKLGGTSSQFLKADGSVDGNLYALAYEGNQNKVQYSYHSRLASYLQVIDRRSEAPKPNSYESRNISAFFNMAKSNGMPDDSWWSGFHVRGWGDGYCTWELIGPSSTGNTAYNLRYRTGIGDTWGDWKMIMTDVECDKNYVKKAGDTMTGNLNVPFISTAVNPDNQGNYFYSSDDNFIRRSTWHAALTHLSQKQLTLDLTSLDQNKWYPCIIGAPSRGGTPLRITLFNGLRGNKPTWGSHQQGFSLLLDYEVTGSGWGTIPIAAKLNWYAGSNGGETAFGGRQQNTMASTEIIYLRGGGMYYYRTTNGDALTVQPNGYTWSSGSYKYSAPVKTSQDNSPIEKTFDQVYWAPNNLRNTRTIWGQPFNGSQNVSGALSGVTTINASNTIYTAGDISNGGYIYCNGRLYVDRGRYSSTATPSISLAIGDTDTGFHWSSDGVVNFYSNAKNVGQWDTGAARFHNVSFREAYNNDYNGLGLMVNGNGTSNTVKPGIGFHQPGVYANSLRSDGPGDFRFCVQGGTVGCQVQAGSFYANGGLIYSNANGCQAAFGSQSVSYVHITNNANRAYYMDHTLHISGDVAPYTNEANALGNSSKWWGEIYGKEVYVSSWVRFTGASGVYWTAYSGGWTMYDATYIRSYGGKSLWIEGNILANGGITAKTTSDMRLKNKIGNSNYIEKLLSLGPVFDYTYNDIAKSRIGKMVDDKRHIGLSYQAVSKVLPAICGKDDDGYGYINYISPDFISLIAGATQLNTLGIKELYKKTNSIEDEIKKLKKENECLKKEINKLKREYR